MHTSERSRLPASVDGRVDDLLARLDRVLPGWVEGFYVVGSVALGAFREGRSDIDFVAVVGKPNGLDPRERGRLRAVHRGRWMAALGGDMILRRSWPLVCNGIYLEQGALARSPLEVTPLAGHVAGRFATAPTRGFDVNPVTWRVLAQHGIAVRGPEPGELEIHSDPAELRAWTRANLDTYWRDWVARARRRGPAAHGVVATRRFAAAGVLGVSRLHHTLATGEIVSKEEAGEYALRVFGAEWHAVIEDALAFWRGARSGRGHPSGRGQPSGRAGPRRIAWAADFVAHVIDCALNAGLASGDP